MYRFIGKIYREIPLASLHLRKTSPARAADPSIEGLAENIRQVGIVHPLTVRYCGVILRPSGLQWTRFPVSLPIPTEGRRRW